MQEETITSDSSTYPLASQKTQPKQENDDNDTNENKNKNKNEWNTETDTAKDVEAKGECRRVFISEKYYVRGPGTGTTHAALRVKKEKSNRKETAYWKVGEEELTHAFQLQLFEELAQRGDRVECVKGWCDADAKREYLFRSVRRHLQDKLSGYKLQDRRKQWDDAHVIRMPGLVRMISQCGLKCFYCACEVFVLYEKVLEPKQWSLDRCCNDKGHTEENVVVACLECNLKRRRQNKDAFLFTKTKALNVHKTTTLCKSETYA